MCVGVCVHACVLACVWVGVATCGHDGICTRYEACINGKCVGEFFRLHTIPLSVSQRSL